MKLFAGANVDSGEEITGFQRNYSIRLDCAFMFAFSKPTAFWRIQKSSLATNG
jgi:hypothetical protein